jgi:uncharacterized protein YbaA (DUF1428 family)
MTQENTITGYTVEEQPVNTAAAENVAMPNLGVLDLNAAAQIIDIAVTRGAFRANEVAQVGVVYNKLTAFVQAVQAQQKEATQPADAQ